MCALVFALQENKTSVDAVYTQLQDMRDALPVIWWKAVCYHYVRRGRQVLISHLHSDAIRCIMSYIIEILDQPLSKWRDIHVDAHRLRARERRVEQR